MKLYLDDREVFNAQLAGIDPHDYPDFVDAYFESAEWQDGTELNDQELEDLKEENWDAFFEMAIDTMFDMAN